MHTVTSLNYTFFTSGLAAITASGLGKIQMQLSDLPGNPVHLSWTDHVAKGIATNIYCPRPHVHRSGASIAKTPEWTSPISLWSWPIGL